MRRFWDRLPPRENRIVRIFWTAFAMMIIAFGIYLQLKVNIGLSPWNALNNGFSLRFPITYGEASICVAAVVIIADLLLGQKIGAGTLVDSVVVGTGTDFFERIDPVGSIDAMPLKIAVFVVGLAIVCYGQYLYMEAGLCCGPRDMLTIAIGKKFSKTSIGVVSNVIFAVVLLASWLLGSPVGVGTLIAVFGNGFIMDGIFRLVRFEPRDVQHEDLLTTLRVIFAKKQRSAG